MDLRTPTQRLLACIGDPSRYRLLVRLSEQRLCVSELATEVGLSQSCTTRHLQALTAVGLVRPAREGKRVVYAVRDDDPEVERLVHWVRGVSPGAIPPGTIQPPVPPPPPRVERRPRRTRTAGAPVADPPNISTRAALTDTTLAGDGAVELDSTEIQRPPRAADLEDFLL
jgi:ArsR family transcriptional regulator